MKSALRQEKEADLISSRRYAEDFIRARSDFTVQSVAKQLRTISLTIWKFYDIITRISDHYGSEQAYKLHLIFFPRTAFLLDENIEVSCQMNKDFIIKDVNDYLAGKITRSELSFRVKNRRTATPFLLDHYCSYANLLLDGVEQKLMAIPEQSYCDDDLKRIIAVLEGRQSVQYHFVYVIPNQMIDSDLQKLMQITESFLYNLEQGKTHRIKVGVRLTNGEDIYNNTDAFFTQEEYDFCQSMHDILSNDTQDTVVKSVARNLLSIINRYVGGWESITTYFASTQTIPGDILSKDLKRSLQALCGKRPIYVTLHGRIDNLNATIVL